MELAKESPINLFLPDRRYPEDLEFQGWASAVLHRRQAGMNNSDDLGEKNIET